MHWLWIGFVALLLWLFLRHRVTSGRSLGGAAPSAETVDPPEPALDDPPHLVPIEDSLDLHTFSPRDMVAVADEYLQQAWQAGFEEVRLIHGKGTGFQRDRVRELLSTHPLVASFRDAPPERGGWGATLVRLKCGRGGKRPLEGSE